MRWYWRGDGCVHALTQPLAHPQKWQIQGSKCAKGYGDTTTSKYCCHTYRSPGWGCCAAVQIGGYECYAAEVGYDPDTTHAQSRSDTTWTLVERIADSGGGIPGATSEEAAGVRIRVEAGQTCPREGCYLTPATVDSRRRFKQGEVMAEFNSKYGATIWQWGQDQS